jgi:HK97 family phage prohead protease
MKLERKSFALNEYKAVAEDGGFYVSGYANTKNHPDSYGHIPTGDNVYDLSIFKFNPIAVMDHNANLDSIFGVFTEIKEDEVGLFVKLKLMENPQTERAKHAVELYKTGFARGFSICGIWEFDPQNKNHLIKATIYEISGVAIPADHLSLANTPMVKSLRQEIDVDMEYKRTILDVSRSLVAGDYQSFNEQKYNALKSVLGEEIHG